MGKLDDDLDALFKLPLAEFTAARNALAAQLKKGGRANEAEFVKSLTKPSISAWTVNQLYWQHRDPFKRLLAAGERFRQAQSSRLSRKVNDMRDALDARRESLTNLADLATELLQEAGHSPTQDTIRRVTTTLEALSAYGSVPDGPRPGRLTQDVDPPGFESLASFVPGPARKPETVSDARKLEQTRQARIAEAKALLQEAKSLLTEARAKAKELDAEQKKVSAEAKEAEKLKREVEERFQKAKAVAEAASRRARNVSDDADEAAQALKDAERGVEKATKELEALFREAPGK